MHTYIDTYIHTYIQVVTMNTLYYRHTTHKDVSANDATQIARRSHKIIILYFNTYYCVTTAYNIQYSNMLYSL